MSNRKGVPGLAALWIPALAAVTVCVLLCAAALRAVMAEGKYNSALRQISSGTGDGIRDLQQAIRLRPDVAEYYRRLAQQESFADPAEARTNAERAARLDRYDWQVWRTLGLIDFQLGQQRDAWSAFQQGLELNRGWASHYQAANLALLLDKTSYFWSELRTALLVAPPDQVGHPIALAISQDGGDASKVLAVLPRSNRAAMPSAVEAILSSGHLELAAKAWEDIEACNAPQRELCGSEAAAIADRLVDEPSDDLRWSNDVHTAEAIWNRAVASEWLPQALARRDQISDPNFEHAWSGPAFSWSGSGGLPHSQYAMGHASGQAIVWPLDGSEPEDALLMRQWILVSPGQVYKLSYHARADGEGGAEGLLVSVAQHGGARVLQVSAPLSSAWTTSEVEFRADGPAVEIQFRYHRPQGQTLLRVPLEVAEVSVHPMRP